MKAPWERKLKDQLNRISKKPTVAKATVGFLFYRDTTNGNMNRALTNFDFEAGDAFDLFPTIERGVLENQFANLKDDLLGNLLEETNTVSLQPRLELAANEAAALAWTTEYPLLVFPALLDELARRERLREDRQQKIRARSEKLMACAV